MSSISFSIPSQVAATQSAELRDVLARLTAGHAVTLKEVPGAADPRLRAIPLASGRRAMVFRGQRDNGDIFLVVAGEMDAAEAQDFAARTRVQVNPINGVMELVKGESTAPAAAQETEESGGLGVVEHAEASDDAPAGDAFPSPQVLYRELGLNPKLGAMANPAVSSRERTRALERAQEWEKAAVLALADGDTVAEVREELGLAAPDPSLSPDEQLLASAKKPATAMQFVYAADAEDLRRVIESADYAAWRTYLHPTQLDLTRRWFNGPARVFGGAGTGKTVVAVHRVRNLAFGEVLSPKQKRDDVRGAERGTSDRALPRIILTTFNADLATMLRQLLKQLDRGMSEIMVDQWSPGPRGVMVTGIDGLAHQVTSEASAEAWRKATTALLGRAADCAPNMVNILNSRDELKLLHQALSADTHQVLRGVKRDPTFLQAEWEQVVLANGITDRSGYLRVRRAGRGVALNRSERSAVWQVLDTFRTRIAEMGRMGFPTRSALAAKVVELRVTDPSDPLGPERYADHVVIDEAQDFNVGHWLLVRALVPEGANDIFLAEDAHQRIYGRPLVLEHFGIRTRGRARCLKINYRTTEENLLYAARYLAGENFPDVEGTNSPAVADRSLRSGPAPRKLPVGSRQEAYRATAKLIRKWQREAGEAGANALRIAVLVRVRRDVESMVNALDREKIRARAPRHGGAAQPEEVTVITMHSAKGQEFTHVILLAPHQILHHAAEAFGMRGADAETRENAERRERSLIYVAASRARDELAVIEGW